MKQFFQKLDPRRHLPAKIWFSTTAIVLSALFIIGLSAQFLFSSYLFDQAQATVYSDNIAVADSLDSDFHFIIQRFIELSSSTDFRSEMKRIASDSVENFTQLNNDLQDILNEFCSLDSMIDSAILVSKGGIIYRPVIQSFRPGALNRFLYFSESMFSGISLLGQIQSPNRSGKYVLPLAFPMKNQSNHVAICRNPGEADVVLYLLLNVDKVNRILDIYGGNAQTQQIYLVNAGGQILNEDASFSEDQLSGFQTSILNSDSASILCGSQYLIYSHIYNPDLYLVYVVSKRQLTSALSRILQILLYTALGSIVLISMISLFASLSITKPFRRLTLALHAMTEGSYNASMVLQSPDETGELSRSMDTMYETIQSQFEQISREKQLTFSAQMRLLAEQINPHFLYNTLEYINMEVYNHHNDTAALMIQCLGDFLRIGLNFGEDYITVSREFSHVQAYLAIMDHRFTQKIVLTTDIEEGLSDYLIPKVILQPLAENSLRHGFLMKINNSFIALPSIHICAARREENLILSVTDNGVGIDIERAESIMHTGTDGQKHIGLNNVYQRLYASFEDKVSITFSSIPYYKNTVSICIPLALLKQAERP